MFRTHTCGELRKTDIGKQVTLSGWIKTIRILKGLIFIDLRDRYGVTQISIDEEKQPEIFTKSTDLKRESVIKITGIVQERFSKNPELPTGEIEIKIENFSILSPSKTPPFTIMDETDGGEELLLKYRYLDLRRDCMKENILLRHSLAKIVREFLHKNAFLEIETPLLIKSTPEGARDFLVPSRLNKGEFYSLPQSPQIYKQLLMVSGFDKYFQIVKCFRDEDFRADRQPEFTQIDCELSFVEKKDVMNVFETMMKEIFLQTKGIKLPDFPIMKYQDALENYGTDSPDTRYDLKIQDYTEIIKNRDFQIFNSSEFVGAISITKDDGDISIFSRKKIDALTSFIKSPQVGAKGMVYAIQDKEGNIKSSVDKFYSDEDKKNWFKTIEGESILFFLSGKKAETLKALGKLREKLALELDIIKKDVFSPLWIVEFPLFEKDEETNKYNSTHHPFTSPEKGQSINAEDKTSIRAEAYDMVINGAEVGGGSIRIYDREVQKKIFSVLGFSEEEAQSQFGFLLDAFEYGVPPHGGIAFGLDRICSILQNGTSIRDFIAFPKNNSGKDLMSNSPNTVSSKQLEELGIETTNEE